MKFTVTKQPVPEADADADAEAEVGKSPHLDAFKCKRERGERSTLVYKVGFPNKH